jgi:molecular chaperone DnaK
MTYKIGVDFGTTNSTVAYINESNKLEAFRYPDPAGYEYIPSCMVYEQDGNVSVGWAAQDLAGDTEVTFCNNFKMILPLSETEQSEYEWTKKKKADCVTADFLGQILTDISESGFESQKGQIDGLVLSVPHVWAKAVGHIGRSRLQKILTDDLQLPLKQLISEPVAAAAYYAYRIQQEDDKQFTGNLLVCDMGGGTFDVTLCSVTPGKVEELYNDGNGRCGLGKAGVYFDRKIILDNIKGTNENSSELYRFYKLLQDYKAHNHDRITKNISNVIDDPDLRQDIPIIRVDNISFNYNNIMQAFEEVNEGIVSVLTRFKTFIEEKKYNVDAIFLVGGFTQFHPVREAIKSFWAIKENDSRFNEKINREISRYAIAYGAALVANGLIIVEEKFEHTLGIEGFETHLVEGREVLTQKPILIPIITGGEKLSDYEKVHYATGNFRVYLEKPEISIYVDQCSGGRPVAKKLPEDLNIQFPKNNIYNNQWRVGMCIDRSKIVYLVFENEQGDSIQYELGDVLRQMFGGLEYLREE